VEPIGSCLASASNGRLEHVEPRGRRDANGAVVEADTVFYVASVAKPVAALVGLRLVAAGNLDLDAPVNRYLGAAGLVTPGGAQVRVRQLLTHTSGLTLLRARRDAFRPSLTIGGRRERAVEDLYPARTRTAADPDTLWSYGSHGYGVLQRIVEQVCCDGFAAVAEREVFAPLGLRHAAFSAFPPPGWARAHGCRTRPRAHWYRHRVFVPLAGGSLWVSAPDLAVLFSIVAGTARPDWLALDLRRELFTPQPFAGDKHPFMVFETPMCCFEAVPDEAPRQRWTRRTIAVAVNGFTDLATRRRLRKAIHARPQPGAVG
jgi:CubicO group peptidase (beta-lactamase class C family)